MLHVCSGCSLGDSLSHLDPTFSSTSIVFDMSTILAQLIIPFILKHFLHLNSKMPHPPGFPGTTLSHLLANLLSFKCRQ
jgi:hypothetical protein